MNPRRRAGPVFRQRATVLLRPTAVGLLVAALAARALAQPGATPVNLSRSLAPSRWPVIAASDNQAMAVWVEGDALHYALQAGTSWGPAAAIPAAGSVRAGPALAAAPGGRFEVAWSSTAAGGDAEILHSQYDGSTWSLPDLVAETGTESAGPRIAVAGDGAVLVAWTECVGGDCILYLASASGSGEWSYGPLPVGQASEVALASGGGAWHLAWTADVDADGAPDLLYLRRASGAAGPPEVVTMGGPSVEQPTLAVDQSGAAAVAWRSGGNSVLVSQQSDHNWLEPTDVDAGHGAGGGPALAVSEGSAVVAWPLSEEVLVARQEAGAWAAPRAVFGFGERAESVALALAGRGVGLVTSGRDSGAEPDVFYLELLVRESSATPPPATRAPTAASTVTATATGPVASATATGPERPATGTPPTVAPSPSPPWTPAATSTAGAGQRLIFLPAAHRQAQSELP